MRERLPVRESQTPRSNTNSAIATGVSIWKLNTNHVFGGWSSSLSMQHDFSRGVGCQTKTVTSQRNKRSRTSPVYARPHLSKRPTVPFCTAAKRHLFLPQQFTSSVILGGPLRPLLCLYKNQGFKSYHQSRPPMIEGNLINPRENHEMVQQMRVKRGEGLERV